MPKIIKNIREALLSEAKRQIAERGYAGTTVRSVADACGIGVGTVYNYFPSKEMLIASFMAEDWLAQLDAIAALPKEDPKKLLHGIYESLGEFAESNKKLFSDSDAAKVISLSFSARHKMLRAQLAEFILPICTNVLPDAAFTSEFVSEALISWAMEGKDFDSVYGVLEILFENNL